MKILTAEEIRKVERISFERYFTEAELMKRAGQECSKTIIKYFGNEIKSNKVSIVCGNGKNAGDGFVIAKELLNFGAEPEIVIADKMPEIEEPLMYFKEAEKMGVKVIDFKDCVFDGVLIVDCIFGIGFHGEPKEPFNRVFDKINSSHSKVVAIDVPSGVNSTDATVNKAVKADLTIAISTLKYCHVLPPANEYCGKTVCVNIGIPSDCYEENYINTITKKFVKNCFAKRKINSNKGNNGHQLNICGSYLMPGAAVICAKSALKSGVGLLKCAFPKSIYNVMTTHLIEPIFSPMSENEDKTFSIGSLNSIIKELEWANCVAIGCGLGKNGDTEVVVNQVIKESKVPIVLDADGINSIVANKDVLKDSKAQVVLTPHPGEMARLIDKPISFVQANRIEVAKSFAQKYNTIVVLKGANTVVTDGNEVFVNTTGNAGMAMGGTGDMLTGMIASFIAQGINPFNAAKCGVYIHGLCGDITAKELSQRGMSVNDMIELLGALMSEFE